jgi:hypothetical protein
VSQCAWSGHTAILYCALGQIESFFSQIGSQECFQHVSRPISPRRFHFCYSFCYTTSGLLTLTAAMFFFLDFFFRSCQRRWRPKCGGVVVFEVCHGQWVVSDHSVVPCDIKDGS